MGFRTPDSAVAVAASSTGRRIGMSSVVLVARPSGAVAQASFTAFVSRPKGERIARRLIVRGVKRRSENAEGGQDTLFDAW